MNPTDSLFRILWKTIKNNSSHDFNLTLTNLDI